MKSIFTLLIIFSLFLCGSVSGQINHDWSFSIGSTKSEGSGGSVVDHEGSVYILMIMKDTVDVDPGPAIVEIIPENEVSWILTKYDSYGNLVYGNPFYTDENSSGAVLEARHNQARIYLNFHDSLVYEQNGFRQKLYDRPGNNSAILTLDLNGNVIDSYFYAINEDSYLASLYTFPDGRTLIAGSFSDTLIFNPQSPIALVSAGGEDGYFMMLDANYNPLWYQHFKGTGYNYIDDLTVINDQKIYFTAGYEDTLLLTTTSGPLELVSEGEQDGIFGYITVNGGLEKVFSLKGPGHEEIRDITADTDGNMFVCGFFEQTINFAHPSQPPVFRTSTAESDGYISKYDEDGNLDWLGIYPSSDYAGVHNVVLKRNDELYFTGSFTLKGDLNPGPDSMIVNSGYHSSPFISKLKTNGEFLWSVPFLTNEVAGIREISVLTEESRIVVNGIFYDSIHMGTIEGENWLDTDYGADCFVASYSEENVTTANHEILGQVSPDMFNVFPNPVTENCTILSRENLSSISLYNSSGELVRQMENIDNHQTDMNLNGLPAGLYYITGTSQDKVMTSKVIKQ